MIDEAQSDELRAALPEHLEVTKTQAERIETICEELGTDPENEKGKGMEGVLKEGSDLLKETGEPVRETRRRVRRLSVWRRKKRPTRLYRGLAESMNAVAGEPEVETSKTEPESPSDSKLTRGKNKPGGRGRRVARVPHGWFQSGRRCCSLTPFFGKN
jgi:hypothetical protein